jgi:hypothetical protein
MKQQIEVKGEWRVIAVAAVAVAGFYWILSRDVVKAGAAVAGAAKDAAVAAGNLVNPTQQNNLADRAVDGTVQSITMRPNDSAGKWVWRLFASDEEVARMDKYVAK